MDSLSPSAVSPCAATATTLSSTLTNYQMQVTDAPASYVTFQPAKYILLFPRRGPIAAPSPIPHNQTLPCVPQQQQPSGVIKKADILTTSAFSADLPHPSPFSTTTLSTISLNTRSMRSMRSTPPSTTTTPILDHSTSPSVESGRPTSISSLASSKSGSSRADSESPASPTHSHPLPSCALRMTNTYFPLHLSTPDPLQALFKGPDGRILFGTCTNGRTTVIRRLYGRSAKSSKNRQKHHGLVLAEIEWMDRVRSSRIRFMGADVGVRIDEYLKETRGGSGQSRMFATSDGRMYKWKASGTGDSAELFECASGKRVSGLLASSNPCRPPSGSDSLPTPPSTPPVILSPSPSDQRFTASSHSPAWVEGFQVPSISLSEPETRHEREKPTLKVHTSVLNLVDQIVVTWVIMEHERAMRMRD